MRYDNTVGHLIYKLDRMGNVRAILGTDGQILEAYAYDAFGQPTVSNWDGSSRRSASAFKNRFMFTGREWIKEFGIYDYRNRFYHPKLGRFLQPDPIGFAAGDANLFRYCGGDPVNWVDPYGLVEVQINPANLARGGDGRLYPTERSWAPWTPGSSGSGGGLITRPNSPGDIGRRGGEDAKRPTPGDQRGRVKNPYDNGPGSNSTGIAFGSDSRGGAGESGGLLDATQLVLDIAGLVPVFGEAADGINAAIYAYNGDYLNASLSAAAMIPVGGQAFTAAKLANKTRSAFPIARRFHFPTMKGAREAAERWSPIGQTIKERDKWGPHYHPLDEYGEQMHDHFFFPERFW
jgi:RHS repeat-associated protein